MRASILRLLAILLLFSATSRAADTPAPVNKGMEVVALGTGGPAATGRASSGFMILLNGTPRVLVDAGGGTFARVSELSLSLTDLDLVLLTHLHIDHCAEVPAIFKARGITHRGPYTFRVFGPSGAGVYPSVTQWLKLLFGKGGAFAYQPEFNGQETFEPTNLTSDLTKPPAIVYDKDGLRVTTVATHHGDCPSVAYRVDYVGASVTFSGDLDASALPNLAKLAAGTNLLIVNAVVLDPPDSPEVLYELHSPPGRIGETARDAKVGRVLLSHIGPSIEKNLKSVKASIARAYSGPVEMAEDKSRYPVSP